MPKITRIEPLPKLSKLKRVAAYARVSSGKDAMLHSLSSQVSYFSDYIQSRGDWQYAGVFYDEGMTGTKENREGFQKLLAACRAGKIDMIIVKSITRFSRNTLTNLQAVRELKELGVDVFCQKENIHTLGVEEELVYTILAAFAQEESKSASDNQKWRIHHAFEQGKAVCWRSLFGYRIKRGIATVVPEEAQIVQEVFRRAIEGESFGSIAGDLQDRRIKRPDNGRWCHQRIREMLENEKYMGDILCQKTFVVDHIEKRKKRNKGEKDRFRFQDGHESIIDKETYDKAQERLKRLDDDKKRHRGCKRSAYSGTIRCGICGRNYRSGNNNHAKVWLCASYKERGAAGCPSKKIREDVLNAITAEVLGLERFDPLVFEQKISLIRAEGEQTLVYCFQDGHEEKRQWVMPSRSDSWTAGMREKARQRCLARKGEKDAESNRHSSDH